MHSVAQSVSADKHHRGMASASRDLCPGHHGSWCLPASSDILELWTQQSPTKGGTDGTVHRDGCALFPVSGSRTIG